jgi:hypothetical protein
MVSSSVCYFLLFPRARKAGAKGPRRVSSETPVNTEEARQNEVFTLCRTRLIRSFEFLIINGTRVIPSERASSARRTQRGVSGKRE